MSNPSALNSLSESSRFSRKSLRYLPHALVFLGVIFTGFLFLFEIILGSFIDVPEPTRKFPAINVSTRIVLTQNRINPRNHDLSGDPEVISALNQLKYGSNISGRSVGDRGISGIIKIDDVVFEIDASHLDNGGYRATLRNNMNGWWDGNQLAEVLLKKIE